VYLSAVLCTMLSTVLFVAPTTYHRIRFRDHDKEQLIYTANRLVIAGTAFLAAAMCCAVYLVSEYVFNLWVGIATTAVTALSFAFFWYALPLSREAARRKR